MTKRAKAYIAAIIILGLAVLAGTVLFSWKSPDPRRWLIYLAITVPVSMWKVRLPGLTGTISPNFLFVLIGLAEFSLSQTILLACAGALVQTVWKSRTRPKLLQLSFNLAVLSVSTALSYAITHFVMADSRYLPLLLTTAASVYLFTNTLLVSGVLSLVEYKPLTQIWKQCHLWTFPYYLAGGAIAGLVCQSSRSVGWYLPLLSLPLMYFLYKFYRFYVEHLGAPVVLAPSGGAPSCNP